jgi:hypothetical protein
MATSTHPTNPPGLKPGLTTLRGNLLAAALLLLMLCLCISSSMGDSASFDEVAHIPAAYSYIQYGDYRINPEHPPLMKDLAGIPLHFLDLQFPDDEAVWTTHVNDQFELGRRFLYTMGNDADQILFWARLPLILFAVAFGFVLHTLCRRRWGVGVALVAVFFYALSPNILAHSRYVTTDAGVSIFFFLSLMAYVGMIEKPRAASIVVLALALAGVQLAKLSAVTAFLYLGLVTLVVVVSRPEPQGFFRRLKVYGGGFVLACVLSVGFVWLFYFPHTMNMPLEVQDQLIRESITARRLQPVAHLLVQLNDLPLMKPLVQYLLGVVMVLNRVAGGGLTYFNGMTGLNGFKGYFPELFAVKTQIGFLALSAVGLTALLYRSPALGKLRRLRGWLVLLHEHFALWVLLGFAVFYFMTAVFGNLNLGIRHILPIYIPLFVVAAVCVARFWQRVRATKTGIARTLGLAFVPSMLAWYGLSCIWIHPAYTSYFNEFIGGPDHALGYFADSSVDWGQDLRRLKHYVDSHPEIDRLAVDYQGGGDVRYYFCRRYPGAVPAGASRPITSFDCSKSVYDADWSPDKGPYQGSYIAVSESQLAFDPFSNKHYTDLRARDPVAKIGYSIFLYKLR